MNDRKTGLVWKKYQGVLMPNCAPHVDVEITKKTALKLIKENRAFLLMYPSEFDKKSDGEYWYIIKDGMSTMDQLDSKRRNELKKGLRFCHVRKVDVNIINSKEGYRVYEKAVKGYGKIPDQYEEYRKNFKEESGEEYWGVFTKDELLIGYARNTIMDSMCGYSSMKFDPEYLNLHSSYALIYEMNNHYLNERRLLYVSDGAKSLQHETNIQQFLIKKFLFRKAYCHLNIVYHPLVYYVIAAIMPFRTVLRKFDCKLIRKLDVALKLEEMRRNQEKHRYE